MCTSATATAAGSSFWSRGSLDGTSTELRNRVHFLRGLSLGHSTCDVEVLSHAPPADFDAVEDATCLSEASAGGVGGRGKLGFRACMG